MKENKIGRIAFLAGLILAAIFALFGSIEVAPWVIVTIGVLGFVVGLMNIKDREVTLFLIASITFLISFQALSSLFTTIAFGWEAVSTFFGLMNVFVAPAAAVVAIKAILGIAQR